jgi:acyl-CoA synthetase (AMP-forming)/AMP-acid ligase II
VRFWELDHPADHLVLIDEATERRWTYRDLRQHVEAFRAILPVGIKQLGFLLCKNTPDCLAAYLGALQAKAAVVLLGADLSADLFSNLLSEYSPDWVATPADHGPIGGFHSAPFGDGYVLWQSELRAETELFPELAILLSTSGSTGSPKLVRLSYTNIQANAESIGQYLRLTADDRPVTSLPMQYSYGLSVINSHLLCGATLLLTDRSLMERRFWEVLSVERATSLAGVPYTYQMILRVGLLNREIPSLRTLTQAGGALAPRFVEQIHALALRRNWSFFVMYGQTEATARISYVPPDKLAEKMNSIGIPVPGGKLRLDPESGEILYSGPNVMLGYASSRSDLSRGDELQGELRTGDVGRQDDMGFFYVTGRMKRFLKIFGQRFSLDEVEHMLRQHFDAPLACYGRDDRLCIATEDLAQVGRVVQVVSEKYHLHHSAISVVAIPQLPRHANGKTDYHLLNTSADTM